MGYEALIQMIDQVLKNTGISANEKCALIDEHIQAEKKRREEKEKEDEFTDTPNLGNKDDIYYTGAGPTYGIDLDGKKYWLLYNPFFLPFFMQRAYENLKTGDIIESAPRFEKVVKNILKEEGLI